MSVNFALTSWESFLSDYLTRSADSHIQEIFHREYFVVTEKKMNRKWPLS